VKAPHPPQKAVPGGRLNRPRGLLAQENAVDESSQGISVMANHGPVRRQHRNPYAAGKPSHHRLIRRDINIRKTAVTSEQRADQRRDAGVLSNQDFDCRCHDSITCFHSTIKESDKLPRFAASRSGGSRIIRLLCRRQHILDRRGGKTCGRNRGSKRVSCRISNL